MPEKETEQHEGHPLAKIEAAYLLAKFFGLQFKVRGAAAKVKSAAADVLGMARRDDFEKLSEEIDRISGKIEKDRQ